MLPKFLDFETRQRIASLGNALSESHDFGVGLFLFSSFGFDVEGHPKKFEAFASRIRDLLRGTINDLFCTL
jgi:hypothetical protein